MGGSGTRREAERSYCTYQPYVDVYWRYCTGSDQDAHINAIVDALLEALSGPDRRWNPHAERLVRSEFRKRIVAASKGQLEPVDEIKSLRGGRDSLFEILWKDINVAEVRGDGLAYVKTDARLIHVEPRCFSIAMVGLVAHEKPHADGSKEIQDECIDQAERIYHGGFAETWGVVERTWTGRPTDIN